MHNYSVIEPAVELQFEALDHLQMFKLAVDVEAILKCRHVSALIASSCVE